jgi:hypothetical protein
MPAVTLPLHRRYNPLQPLQTPPQDRARHSTCPAQSAQRDARRPAWTLELGIYFVIGPWSLDIPDRREGPQGGLDPLHRYNHYKHWSELRSDPLHYPLQPVTSAVTSAHNPHPPPSGRAQAPRSAEHCSAPAKNRTPRQNCRRSGPSTLNPQPPHIYVQGGVQPLQALQRWPATTCGECQPLHCRYTAVTTVTDPSAPTVTSAEAPVGRVPPPGVPSPRWPCASTLPPTTSTRLRPKAPGWFVPRTYPG